MKDRRCVPPPRGGGAPIANVIRGGVYNDIAAATPTGVHRGGKSRSAIPITQEVDAVRWPSRKEKKRPASRPAN